MYMQFWVSSKYVLLYYECLSFKGYYKLLFCYNGFKQMQYAFVFTPIRISDKIIKPLRL